MSVSRIDGLYGREGECSPSPEKRFAESYLYTYKPNEKKRNSHCCIVLFGLGRMRLIGKKEAKEERVDSVAKTAPMEAERKLERSYTAKYGEHTYSISIKRYPNHELPIVKDQLDQEFYDNSVEIVILRDGKSFFEKNFSKEAFLDYLSEADRAGSILLGMAFDEEKSNGSKICIAAQIGQPGSGEGPAFTVEVSTSSAVCSILKDLQQDTNAEETPEGD